MCSTSCPTGSGPGEFSQRRRPEWDQRIDRFAQHLVDVARSSDAEEIVIVGHSSGIVLNRTAGARQARSCAGASRPAHRAADDRRNFPIVGFHAAREGFPRSLWSYWRSEPSIRDWIDCQARKDVMNFYQFDPITCKSRHRCRQCPTQPPPSCRSVSATSRQTRPLRELPLAVLPRAFPGSSWPMSGRTPTTSS